MRILIAIPTFETIYPDTYQSIWEMDKCGHEVLFRFVRGYDCATARNRIAQLAIDLQADYVLMVDNDVVIPKDTLRYMLEDDKLVTLGYYSHRDADNIYRGRANVCKLQDKTGAYYYNYPTESQYTAEELSALRESGIKKLRIHGGGMGCAFIKTDVFRLTDYPWYDWVNYTGNNRGILSEDLFFCEKCKKKKIQIFTDTRVSCGHILRHIQYVE